MSNLVRTEEYKDHNIEIYYDEFENENPIKEDGTLGEYIAYHKRYNLGNKTFDNQEDLKTYIKRRKCFVFNWYMCQLPLPKGRGLS